MYIHFIVLPVIYKPFNYVSIEKPFTFTIFLILILILVLNLYWTVLIMRVLLKFVKDRKILFYFSHRYLGCSRRYIIYNIDKNMKNFEIQSKRIFKIKKNE